jgi:hypothetical protein
MCAGGEDDADGCDHFLCLLAALSHILYREEIVEFMLKKNILGIGSAAT